MKLCAKCNELKSSDEFYVNAKMRGGRHSYCKSCCREINQDARSRTKDAVFMTYGGYVCACCGETEPNFLSIMMERLIARVSTVAALVCTTG
jgi:hypothetical protein